MYKRILTVFLLSVCVTKLVACDTSGTTLEQGFFGTITPSLHIKSAVTAGLDPVKESSPSPSPLVINNEIVAVTPTSITESIHSTPLKRMELAHVFANISYPRMVHLTYPEDGTDRLFLLLQHGQIIVFPNKKGTIDSSMFLDISGHVNDSGNEEGLLGLAFDPDYSTNGFFYVYYSDTSPRRSVISRFSVSEDDPNKADFSSEFVILEVLQPFKNHNGGHLIFGPDGYLYIGLGDGGSQGDPHGNGQDRSTLLGSILRIDVRASGVEEPYRIPPDNPFVGNGDRVREEIWTYGLRNPWRFNFDYATGQLWGGDVGQARYEEVNIMRSGLNYGWNIMEGFHCYRYTHATCGQPYLEPPVFEYSHGEGECSITGGYVYRGSLLPSLLGAYIYGDFCSGKVWALHFNGTNVTENVELLDSGVSISAFGEDQNGEIYILSFDRKIFQMESAR